jgi:hypothetical protein
MSAKFAKSSHVIVSVLRHAAAIRGFTLRISRVAVQSSRLRAVGRYGHSESSANLSILLGLNSALFSECVLISLTVQPDFDSTMERLESSPSQAVRCTERMPMALAERPDNGALQRLEPELAARHGFVPRQSRSSRYPF